MGLKHKESLADEIFAHQRNLLVSIRVLPKFGVSYAKLELALDIQLICYHGMKESGLRWPLISVDDQEYQMERESALLKHQEAMHLKLRAQFEKAHIERQPEAPLLVFVSGEVSDWLATLRIAGAEEECDKYVMMATSNLVNCIAYVKLEQA